MSKYLNDAYTLRIPAELKAKIAESAKANNRSMNADIVARLEKSFSEKTTLQQLEGVQKEVLLAAVIERYILDGFVITMSKKTEI